MTGSSVVESVRDAALARAAAIGLPTTALEDWRYVNVKPLAATLALTPAIARPVSEPAVINGAFVEPGLFKLPDDATRALEAQRLTQENEGPACWSWTGDCRYARISGRQALTLDHQNTTGQNGWRLLLDLYPGAECDLTLIHDCSSGSRASVGIVITLAPGARLHVHELDRSAGGQVLIQVDARVDRDATLTWTCAGRGSALQRWRGVIDLVGTGAHADIAALDQVSGTDQAHRHLRVRHRVGPTTSTQLFKAVLADHATASFDGLVDIATGADGANAEQLSRTLLLSPTARGDTRPQLDVHADEVKAAHGATIGQLDADELLYLRMRGLDPVSAKSLLVDGFVQEVTTRLPAAAQQAWLARSTP